MSEASEETRKGKDMSSQQAWKWLALRWKVSPDGVVIEGRGCKDLCSSIEAMKVSNLVDTATAEQMLKDLDYLDNLLRFRLTDLAGGSMERLGI